MTVYLSFISYSSTLFSEYDMKLKSLETDQKVPTTSIVSYSSIIVLGQLCAGDSLIIVLER